MMTTAPTPDRSRLMASEKGFSLIELLLSLTITLVIVGIAFSAFSSARRNAATESSAIEAQQAARITIDELGLTVHQAGYGTNRVSANRAIWQRTIVFAGAHVLAFNADIESSIGPLATTQTLSFPQSQTYAGEGTASSTSGAETYVYTLDADDDGSITQADRTAAATGILNPAAATPVPLDYALFRRIYGWDGSSYGGTLTPLTGYLFTNATVSDLYADNTPPSPIFLYYLTEDLNADLDLDVNECVVSPCPPTATRLPLQYLWGDTNFDGVLSSTEKVFNRVQRVGSPLWSGNRLVSAGAYPSTTLSTAVDPSAGSVLQLQVTSASAYAPGEHISIGSGGTLEKLAISQINTAVTPHVLTLSASPIYAHAAGETIQGLEQTFLRAIRAIRINFDAITPDADMDTATGDARAGRAGRVGSHGLAYRVRNFERRVDLMNMRAGR